MKGGCQSVSVGPYCTLDGDVQGPIGFNGNRQNTAKKLFVTIFIFMKYKINELRKNTFNIIM